MEYSPAPHLVLTVLGPAHFSFSALFFHPECTSPQSCAILLSFLPGSFHHRTLVPAAPSALSPLPSVPNAPIYPFCLYIASVNTTWAGFGEGCPLLLAATPVGTEPVLGYLVNE